MPGTSVLLEKDVVLKFVSGDLWEHPADWCPLIRRPEDPRAPSLAGVDADQAALAGLTRYLRLEPFGTHETITTGSDLG